MSSSFWSIPSDRSSSSLSLWEEESDEQTESHLQNMIETIDDIVFTGHPIPQHFSEELAEECRVWRQKFEEKTQSFNPKINKQSSKLKALSAPKMSEPINFKYDSHIRSLSEQRFVSSKTRLNSIQNKSNNRKDMANGSDKELIISEKPLILPPIVNPNTINRSRNQSQTNKSHINFVPNFTKTHTSFPKPAPVLSLEQILSRSQSSLIEENGTKFPIVLHLNHYKRSHQKGSDRSQESILPIIHK